MNKNTLVVVCAYDGDIHQVEQNIPGYTHHGCPVVVMSPEDGKIIRDFGAGVTNAFAGLKGWIGPQTLERQRLMLELMLEYPAEYFLVNDADSVCLSPMIPQYLYDAPKNVVWSNEVLDTNPGETLLPKIALQPPYFFSRLAIRLMLETAKNPPTSYISGRTPEGWPLPHPTQCIDHYMLQLASGPGLEHRNFLNGASFETTSDHGLKTMSDLVRVHGRVLVHQVKTRRVFAQLTKEHAIYAATHR